MFNFSLDRRTISIMIAVLLGAAIIKYVSNPNALIALLLSAPAVLVAITFHEFAHGLAAYILGDDTAKREGRLSLNPFAHLDLIGTAMLLVAGFGWGKPVCVDPRNYTRKISMETGEAIVSAAGPVMNFLLAIVFAIIYFAVYKFAQATFLTSTVGLIIMSMLQAVVSINIGLGVFNILPLPPLDGSKIIRPFLPMSAKEWFENNEQTFYIIFIVIWITGIAGYIITPVISGLTTAIMNLGSLIMGIPI